jgi:hypothetical protein
LKVVGSDEGKIGELTEAREDLTVLFEREVLVFVEGFVLLVNRLAVETNFRNYEDEVPNEKYLDKDRY